MKLSLNTKVSILVTLVILTISILSTYLFTSAHSRSREKGRIIRGTALGYSLSKAAEDGIINEDLDLIKKSSYIIQGPDVTLVQIYSDLWEAIDAYPFERLKEPPNPEAVRHFKDKSEPFYKKIAYGYDFYYPVTFKVSDDSKPLTIGFARIILSSAGIQKELREIVATNIIVSAIITLFAIVAINMLIRRIIIRPVLRLHKSASQFKNGVTPDAVPVYSSDEIGELSAEFNRMSHSIMEKTEQVINSEKRIKSLFERVEHAIFRLDKDGNIIESNRRFQEIYGTVKTLCSLLLSKEKVSDCLVKTTSGKMVHVEEKVMGKHGNELSALLSIYPETDSSGSVIGYDGYIIDITDKKRLEDRLLHAQKMEAIGTLAGGIAHDFNNLLAAILGYASLAKEEISESHPHYRYWNIAEQAAMRGAELTSNLLTFAGKKAEPRLKEPIDINGVIQEIISLLGHTFDKAISIETKIADRPLYILGDSSTLYQALLNICLNARDAMPNGGRLLIESFAFTANEAFLVGHNEASAGTYIQINIADTGTGIDKKVIDKIFEPFFTTKEFGKGTGLGLAIVYSVIKEHRGFIDVYSEQGAGTIYKLYLPAYEKEVIQEVAVQEADDAEIQGKTILVIDDEAPLRRFCTDIFEKSQYNVITAGDGFEAIKILEENKDSISLVLLDMIMPGLSGYETFRKLQAIEPSLKVLITSGFSKDIGAQWKYEKGIAGFIQKPYRAQELLQKVRDALRSQRPKS